MKRPRNSLLVPLCAILLSLAVPRSFAGYDLFLRIDGVQGESTDANHRGDMDALSFQHGEYMDPSGAARVAFSNLTVVKFVDRASPDLMFKCARGEHIRSAVLFVRSQSTTPLEFYKVTLSDVMILSVTAAGEARSPESRPVEVLSLRFNRIDWEYVPQNPDGSTGAPIHRYWDLIANTGG